MWTESCQHQRDEESADWQWRTNHSALICSSGKGHDSGKYNSCHRGSFPPRASHMWLLCRAHRATKTWYKKIPKMHNWTVCAALERWKSASLINSCRVMKGWGGEGHAGTEQTLWDGIECSHGPKTTSVPRGSTVNMLKVKSKSCIIHAVSVIHA